MYNSYEDEDRYEVVINCEDVQISDKKVNYKTSRSLNGKKRQSWNSVYQIFNITFSKIPEEMYLNLRNLSREQLGETRLILGDTFYIVDIEGDTFQITESKIKSEETEYKVYSGSIVLEESEGN